jgi:hypothetical protein
MLGKTFPVIVIPTADADLPAKTFNNEDLPAPEGPRIAQILPDGT